MGSRFQGIKRHFFPRSRSYLGASPKFAATTGCVDGHRGIGCGSEGLAVADVKLAPEKRTG